MFQLIVAVISIALVAEDAPVIIDPADIQPLMEPVAIPQHGKSLHPPFSPVNVC